MQNTTLAMLGTGVIVIAALTLLAVWLWRRRTRTHQQRATQAHTRAASIYMEVNDLLPQHKMRVDALAARLGEHDTAALYNQVFAPLAGARDAIAAYGNYAHSLEISNDPTAVARRRRYKELRDNYEKLGNKLSKQRNALQSVEAQCDAIEAELERAPQLLAATTAAITSAEAELSQSAKNGYNVTGLQDELARAHEGLQTAMANYEGRETLRANEALDWTHAAASEVLEAARGLPQRLRQLKDRHAGLVAGVATLEHEISAAQAALANARASYAKACVVGPTQALEAAAADREAVAGLLPTLASKCTPASGMWNEAEIFATSLAGRLDLIREACAIAQGLKGVLDQNMEAVRRRLKNLSGKVQSTIEYVHQREGDQSQPRAALEEVANQLGALQEQITTRKRPNPEQLLAKIGQLGEAVKRANTLSRRIDDDAAAEEDDSLLGVGVSTAVTIATGIGLGILAEDLFDDD